MTDAEPKGAAPKSVVVIEDEESINEILVNYLVDHGYQVATALDGRKAMELIESGSFDAVLLDLNLPGMDGRAVLAELREHWPDLPAIVISGYVTGDDRELLLKAGANEVFRKPTRLSVIEARLRELTAD